MQNQLNHQTPSGSILLCWKKKEYRIPKNRKQPFRKLPQFLMKSLHVRKPKTYRLTQSLLSPKNLREIPHGEEPESSLQGRVPPVPDEIPPFTETEEIFPVAITPVAEETPETPPADETEASLQAGASFPDAIPLSEYKDISPSVVAPDADEIPEIPPVEEPVSPFQADAHVASETPSIPVMEEPVPVHEVIAPGTDEIPVLSDAARTWADAVRPATTSAPFIPPIVSGKIPDAESHSSGEKADAAHARTIPEQPGAGITPIRPH